MQEYKPPSSQDIPIDFRVELLKNAPNPLGILRSKGTVHGVRYTVRVEHLETGDCTGIL